MNLIQAFQNKSLIDNTKGGKYYETTFDSNLDLYTGVSRYNSASCIILKFHNAYNENRILALANLLYILDIRNGKGERRIFKIIFKDLCSFAPDDARIILYQIASLGRFDYILEGLYTTIEYDVIALIKSTLDLDIKSENPSLLAKWLPSHCTHSKPNKYAKRIIKLLGISEKEYRKMLSTLRMRLNVVEKNLTNSYYDNITFDHVPSKAMLKYNYTFKRKMPNRYADYIKSLNEGESKVNTNGLFCYEIIKKIDSNADINLLNQMWNTQKSISTSNKNILVVADTSGSMYSHNKLPISSSIGLAIYTAEHNTGVFSNKFITFSSKPSFHDVKGSNIAEKVHNIKTIVSSTNIDNVFELILNTMVDAKAPQEDLPEAIVIISDMEFDAGVMSKVGTNFSGWKSAFASEGYKLPKIIFWNVAGSTRGVPVTKNENDVIMVSGFSTNLLENIFSIEKFNPVNQMLEVLQRYISLINKEK